MVWRWVRNHPYFTWSVTGALVLILGSVSYVYWEYAKRIEERLGHGSLRTTSAVYAAPKPIRAGDVVPLPQLILHLQHAGYTEQQDNPTGYYRRTATGIDITTGPESYFQPHSVSVEYTGDRISRIYSQTENKPAEQYWLEPELITNVLDEARGKRRPVAYSEYPQHLVQAVVSVEDKRFFAHSGLDLLRILKAAYVDIREARMEQGASTLTMQLARTFWLDQDKNWRRKLSEVVIATELERRFSKEEIFQLYANEVYLGRSGSFSVHGFGEASRAYFGKDVRQLTLPEAATLSGIVQRPSFYNPFRFPERVKQRRDLVLTLMHNNGYIDAAQLTSAIATPLQLRPAGIESTDAPYFVDLVNEELQDRFEDWDFAQNAYRIYSTLDLDLQRIAAEAIRDQMPQVDKAAMRVGGKKVAGKVLQVALVALDAHTGAIKAFVGGRDYAKSQLNRAIARRPPGSTFKPFVYATALDIGAKNGSITAGTRLIDEPTTFRFNNQPYQPANYGDRYMGAVTPRTALKNSLNIPTIKLAEKAGYQNVVNVVRQAGVSTPLQATPSIALGAYEIPPLELAEAYTIFANGGVHEKRHWIELIRDGKNRPVFRNKLEQNRVLDSRVAYIVTNMMEDVIRSGTASAVRSKGFTQPAAGKTGTAHDGWFAGFTDNLIAVVWIGYDDYTELGLEGAKSALLVWTEFMKRAHELEQYANPKPFAIPEGIVKVAIDATTGLIADEDCPMVRTELFVAGTQPRIHCEGQHYDEMGMPAEMVNHNRGNRGIFGRVLDIFR